MAEKSEFVSHSVHIIIIIIIIEMHENEQNVVLNESSETLGNYLEIVQILVLAVTTANDGMSGSVFVQEFPSLFYKHCTTTNKIFGVICWLVAK